MNQFAIWWLAIRPKTLSISITPVLLGTTLAWYEQSNFSLITVVFILLAALCIQIGTNLYNDAADFEKGADTEQRLGPRRAAQQGWLSSQQLKSGALLFFLLAFFNGIYLVWIGGWFIMMLGLTSILCGYAYTAGPRPIAYSALGELFVLVFFGFAAVGGTYYLQSQTITPTVFLFASTIGCMAAAILLVNNYRDLDSDRKVNKLTLVHYTGRAGAKFLYAALLIYPYLILPVILQDFSWHIILPIVSLPLALKLIYSFVLIPVSAELNQLLAQTAQLQLLYAVLLSAVLSL